MDTKAVEEQYFELVDDTSSKFWAIIVFEKCHTVRYGKIGTVGRSQSKRFESAVDAHLDADRLVASKVKKGYVKARSQMTYTVSPHQPEGALQIAYYRGDDLLLVRRHYPSGHLAEVSYFDKTGRAARQAWFIDRDEDFKPLINPWVLLDLDRLNKRVVRIEKIPGKYPISYRLYDAAGNEI